MSASLRVFLVLAAGIAAVVLALVVLVAHPADTADLLAGGVLAAGVGLIVSVVP